MLIGGATSISGAVGGEDDSGLLRNLDSPALTEGLVGSMSTIGPSRSATRAASSSPQAAATRTSMTRVV
jgi:hypothetical protein